MLQRTTEDNSPPLYYVMLNAWCALAGDSPVAIRSLSVFCAVVALVALYGLANELNRLARSQAVEDESAFPELRGTVRPMSPIVVVGLMATSPFQIALSSETRPYALGVLLATLSTWLFVKIKRGVGTWWTVLAYWFATTLFVYTHHFAWFVIAGQLLFAMGDALYRVRWKLADIWSVPPTRQVAIGIIAVLLVYSPWLSTLVRQTQQVRESFWIPAPDALGVSRLIYRMFVLPTITIPVDPVDAFTAGILFLMVIGCLMWRARAVDLFVLSLIATGIGLPLLVSSAIVSIMNARYFVFTHVFMLLGLALLIERAPTIGTRRVLSLAAIGGSLIAYGLYTRHVDLGNPNDGFMGVAAYLDGHRAHGDTVVSVVPYAYFPVLAHAERKDNLKVYAKDRLLHFYGVAALTPDMIVGERALRPRAGSKERLWLVEMEDVLFELPDGWKRTLRATFKDDFVPNRNLYVTECTAE